MPLPTAEYTLDYTVLGNANPYHNSNFTQIDTGNVQIASGALKPSALNGVTRYRYNGAMRPGATIRAKIELGVAHISDFLWAFLLAPDGSGYGAVVSATSTSIVAFTAGASETGLISGTLSSANSGDILVLEIVPGTPNNTLNTYLNGALSLSVLDNTYSPSLMAFGLGFDPENTNTSTILGFGGDGIAPNSSYYIGGSVEF